MRIGDAYEGWRLVRSERNLQMWQNIESRRFGIYLYESPPREPDEEWLLHVIRARRDDADKLFDAVLSLLA